MGWVLQQAIVGWGLRISQSGMQFACKNWAIRPRASVEARFYGLRLRRLAFFRGVIDAKINVSGIYGCKSE